MGRRSLAAGFLSLLLLLPACLGASANEEKTSYYWNSQAQATLKARLHLELNQNVAKNVILFIGDGMGIPTITAARIYKGQKEGKPGEETQLSVDKFPHVGLIKTYNVDKQVPDSAATATAMFCGVKTNYGLLGVTAKTQLNNCSSAFGNEVSSILQWAQEAGKDTGIVTNTRLTHATPAALYAHSAHRDWESDVTKPDNASDCMDIARQLVERIPGNRTKVILGGGWNHFLPIPYGQRNDSLNLPDDWLKSKPVGKAVYVNNTKALMATDFSKMDYLFGLFSESHVPYEVDRNTGPEGQPSLAEMTSAAIKILKKSSEGFFLMVESGRIDHGHHSNLAKKALEETLAMDDAIEVALAMVDPNNTLFVITADHSHVMTINGYPVRGNPILGIADVSDVDNLPYTTLLYTNGPSYQNDTIALRRSLNNTKLDDKAYAQISLFPNSDETHGGEDVGIFATGPMAHLFYGVQEQNYVAHVLGYAACIGANKDHCPSSAASYSYSFLFLLFSSLLARF